MNKMSSGPGAPIVRSHGVEIPTLGFGTWELRGPEARRMVERALEVGYRHVDTAQAYENEVDVGRALEESGLREEVFLTTKIWPSGYRGLPDAAWESLDRLRTDAVDLLLLHWPRFEGTSLEATVEKLNEVAERGGTRHVGVSNFTPELLERATRASDRPLVVNQVEYHPFLDQSDVLEAVREREMALTAYSPLAKGRAPRDETLWEIGRTHGASAAQVSLRWLVQQDRVTAIPRTSDPEHLRENFDVFDFRLTPEEMRRISDLAEPGGRIIDPEGLAPDWS